MYLSMLSEVFLSMFISVLFPPLFSPLLIVVCIVLVLWTFEFWCLFRECKLKRQCKINAITRRTVKPELLMLLLITLVWRVCECMKTVEVKALSDIVRFIKVQRIKWLGHIQWMDQTRPTRKLLGWRPMGTRPVGRPRQPCQEDVMEDLKKSWK